MATRRARARAVSTWTSWRRLRTATGSGRDRRGGCREARHRARSAGGSFANRMGGHLRSGRRTRDVSGSARAADGVSRAVTATAVALPSGPGAAICGSMTSSVPGRRVRYCSVMFGRVSVAIEARGAVAEDERCTAGVASRAARQTTACASTRDRAVEQPRLLGSCRPASAVMVQLRSPRFFKVVANVCEKRTMVGMAT